MSQLSKVEEYCYSHLYDLLGTPQGFGVSSLAIMQAISFTVQLVLILRNKIPSDEKLWHNTGQLVQNFHSDFGWTSDAYAWHAAYACEALYKEGLLPPIPLTIGSSLNLDSIPVSQLVSEIALSDAKASYYCCSGLFCTASIGFLEEQVPWVHFEMTRVYPCVSVVAIRRAFQRFELPTPFVVHDGFLGITDLHKTIPLDGWSPHEV